MDKKMEKGKMKDDIKEIEEYTSCWDALDFWTKFFFVGTAAHAHQLKDGYKTKFCSFELKSPQMGGFIK
ncbi:hypothetical protein FOL75_15480, partial [Bacillus thuringiensis]|uniref:hypothetical protein n=1 Tax=Bacillus thuringiensis TaxID=1428 RepID=UPI002853F974